MSDFNECSLTRRDQKYQKHPNMFPIFIQFDDFTSVFSEPGSRTRFSEPGEMRINLRRGGIKYIKQIHTFFQFLVSLMVSRQSSENCDQNCGEEGSKMFEKWN